MKKQNSDKSLLRMIAKFDEARSTEISEFQKYLNVKSYRVADTSLSYRQINTLDGNKILRDSRKNKANWRKFSLKELIFLSVIKELRIYGFRDEQLKNLRNAFFKGENNSDSDLAILAVLMGIKIILTVNSANEIYFYDVVSLDSNKGEKYTSFVNINLNEVVARLWEEKTGKKMLDYASYLNLFSKIAGNFGLDKKEAKIMKIYRDKRYRKININKNRLDEIIVKGEKIEKISEEDLTEEMKKINYGNARVFIEDNKIVGIVVEDTYKV